MEFQGRELERRPLTPLPLGAWPYNGTADVGAHSPEVGFGEVEPASRPPRDWPVKRPPMKLATLDRS